MVTLTLKYPQEAPNRLEALLEYLNNWHRYCHEAKHNLIRFNIDDALFRSELFIIKRHFPQVLIDVRHHA